MKRIAVATLFLSACSSFGSAGTAEDAGNGVVGDSGGGGGGPTKLVFVTRDTFKPSEFGDPYSGLTVRCNTEAASATRRFVPWLSTTHANAIDQLPNDGVWKLHSGAVVFSSRDALTKSRLDNVIDQDASGGSAQGPVWTGTDATGRHTSLTCGDWTTNDSKTHGTYGDLSQKGPGWTAANDAPCDGQFPILCFEQ